MSFWGSFRMGRRSCWSHSLQKIQKTKNSVAILPFARWNKRWRDRLVPWHSFTGPAETFQTATTDPDFRITDWALFGPFHVDYPIISFNVSRLTFFLVDDLSKSVTFGWSSKFCPNNIKPASETKHPANVSIVQPAISSLMLRVEKLGGPFERSRFENVSGPRIGPSEEAVL